MADKRIDQLVAATTLGNNDLLVLEQNNQAKKMSGATLASFVYNAATDKIAEVNQAVADAQDAVDSLEEQKNDIAQTIADMAQYGTDTTLTTTGVAADAKATGDRINDAETAALAGLDQAEITGVPIATFDDGADDVPVKALKIAIEPQQDLHGYDYPWPGGGGVNQLSPTEAFSVARNGITLSTTGNGVYNLVGTADGAVSYDVSLTNSYTFPAGYVYLHLNNNVGNGSVVIVLLDADGNQLVNRNAANVNQVSAGISNEGQVATKIRLYVASGASVNMTVSPAILTTSAVTSFTPYSNICPITGWTGANVTRAGKNLALLTYGNRVPSISNGQMVTGNGWTSDFIKIDSSKVFILTKAIGSNISTAYILFYDKSRGYIGNQQLGDTMATYRLNLFNLWSSVGYIKLRSDNAQTVNPTMQLEQGSTASIHEEYKGQTIPITFPSEAGTVYSGTLDVTNGVLTVDKAEVDLGSFTWSYQSMSGRAYTDVIQNIIAPTSDDKIADAICSSYPVKRVNGGEDVDGKKVGVSTSKRIFVTDSSFTSAAEYKSGLSGMQFVYSIATPLTYTLTPPVVRTLLAVNNIWADTGNILDLIYRRQPISDADIQENIDAIRDAIADREDSGVASKNYAGGSLILIGDSLYETAGPITTGESLVPGSNCTATTVAAQIAYIKSIINGLGNLAYLSYETT